MNKEKLNNKLPNIEEGKKYHASSNGLVVFIQPSAKHPGYWWVCKIEHGVWEGFEKPVAPLLLNHWALTLPENLEWQVQDWGGDEMVIPQESPTKKFIKEYAQ